MTVDKIDVADLIELLPGRPRLLALGEPTHGENVLLDLRNEIFRQLVEREQYRTIAIESDCLMGLVVDDYVTTGVGRLDEVMECGFSHEFGAMAGNRELVRWMRAYNDGRPSADQVRFVGFDGPLEITGGASPRQALTALHDYLFPASGAAFGDLLGADEQWLEPAAMRDPARSVGRTPEAERLRLIVDELVDLLTTEAPRLIATTSRAEWERARLYGRTAAGLLRYHFWMADASPDRLARVHRLARVLSARASMMAANLLAVDGPALVFAHNAHLQRDKSSMRLGDLPLPLEWWSAGAIVGAQLGEAYAVVATALGTLRHRGVETPPPNTIEGLLYASEPFNSVVDPRRLTVEAVAPRVSSWFGYAPLDPAHLGSSEAIVFVKDVPGE